MADFLKGFLAAPVALSQPTQESEIEDTMSDEMFKELSIEIDSFRKKVEAGEKLTADENRKLVVWFRARRGKQFTFVKPAKEKKVSTAKSPRAKKEPSKQLSNEDALKLILDL